MENGLREVEATDLDVSRPGNSEFVEKVRKERGDAGEMEVWYGDGEAW